MPEIKVKPGIQTSEFWITLVSKVLSVLVALGAVTASDSDAYSKGFAALIGGIFIVASTWMSSRYVAARAEVKKTAMQES